MLLRKSWIGLWAIFLSSSLSFAQRSGGDYQYLPDIPTIPPPPNAAALGKYGDIPVSTYTGVPSISIPLYEIKLEDFVLPISLDYHAGGVKVDEIASDAGIGWSLNAGGVIARQVNGKAENGTGSFGLPADPQNFYPNNYPTSNDADYVFAQSVGSGEIDSKPDEFFYNFCGKAGEIVFDENFLPHTIPFDPIRIEGQFGINFLITDERGVRYYFDESETTSPKTECAQDQPRFVPNVHKSSHYLTKILTPKGNQIQFTYEAYSYSYYQSWIESSSILYENYGCATNPLATYSCKNKLSISGKRLKTIVGDNGVTVTINYDATDRLDLANTNRIASIVITDLFGNSKTFQLTHSYFGSGTTEESKRLRLDAVLEVGKNPYQFQYNTLAMPARLSYAQDNWGFYNGQNNSTLIPTTNKIYDGQTFHFDGANREPNETYMQMGILSKIIYPTNGYSLFTFEAHDYYSEKPEVVPVQNSLSIRATETDPVVSSTFTVNTTNYPYYTDGSCTQNIIPQQCPILSWTLPDPTSCRYNAHVRGPNGEEMCCQGQASGHIQLVNVPEGDYQMSINVGACEDDMGGRISLSWTDEKTIYNSSNPKVGGLRIQKIQNFDYNDVKIGEKSYDYTMPSDPTKSSGKITGLPTYDYLYVIYHPDINSVNEGEFIFAKYQWCSYFGLTAYSTASLGSTRGSAVGYTNVTEYFEEMGRAGKTTHMYTFFPNQSGGRSEHDDFLPFIDNTSYDCIRGLPTEITDYKLVAGTYQPVKKTTMEYTILHDQANFWGYTTNTHANEKNILSFNIIKFTEFPLSPTLTKDMFAYSVSKFPSFWYYMNKKTEYAYDQNDPTKYIQSQTSYYYDNPTHAQLSRQSSKNSAGNTVTTHSLYSFDYTDNSGTIKDLQDAHIISVPIESVQYLTYTDGSTKIRTGKLNTYKPGGLGLLDKEYVLESATLTALSSFRFSNQTSAGTLPVGTPSSFYLNTTYYRPRISYDVYDTKGKLVQVTPTGGIPTSLIWGQVTDVPLATAKNAPNGSVAYTSFEGDGDGGWADADGNAIVPLPSTSLLAKTGKGIYDNVIAATGLPDATYKVGIWAKAKNGGGSVTFNTGDPISVTDEKNWTYLEKTLSNPGSVTITPNNAYVDEARVYPLGAQMTSATYESMVGTTSATNERNTSTYYEYDAVQRLRLVRDHNRNIVKRYTYNYKKYKDFTLSFTPSNPSLNTDVVFMGTLSGNIATLQNLRFRIDFGDNSPVQYIPATDGQVTVSTGSVTLTCTHPYTTCGSFHITLQAEADNMETLIVPTQTVPVGDCVLHGSAISNMSSSDRVITFTVDGITGNPTGTAYSWLFFASDGTQIPCPLSGCVKTDDPTITVNFDHLDNIMAKVTISDPDNPAYPNVVLTKSNILVPGSLNGAIQKQANTCTDPVCPTTLFVYSASNPTTGMTYVWNFGDGTPTVTTYTAQAPAHSYAKLGQYTVSVWLTHPNYDVTTITGTIYADGNLSASFSLNVARPCVGSLVTYTASSAATNPDAVQYAWNTTGPSTSTASSNTFTISGTYTVTLTISSEGYASQSFSQTFTVADLTYTLHISVASAVRGDANCKNGIYSTAITFHSGLTTTCDGGASPTVSWEFSSDNANWSGSSTGADITKNVVCYAYNTQGNPNDYYARAYIVDDTNQKVYSNTLNYSSNVGRCNQPPVGQIPDNCD